jgi:hypothetical protein
MTDKRFGPRSAKQRSNHDQLLRRLEWRPGARPSGKPLDAIVVPAARRAQHLRGLMHLAACYGTTLVVLASHDCDIDEAAALVARTPGSGRAVLVDVPLEHDHELLRLATSADRFRTLSGDRPSNLSLKRNVGLLLARLRGWNKIMFMDDDLIGMTPEQIARVAHHLDVNRFAGLKTVRFPDNSVVCHTNRLIGRPQGIFVSGAALGVNTSSSLPLEVFPDIYNEDWFAFAGEAQRSGVADVGNVHQLTYNPFENPQRAAYEEFGDLVAEGLYALFNDGFPLSRATEAYWTGFIGERHRLIEKIRGQIEDKTETHELVQAAKSLQVADQHLDKIRPGDCIAFLDAWQDDRDRFAAGARWPAGGLDYDDAFGMLALKAWQEAQFGVFRMPALASISPLGGRR